MIIKLKYKLDNDDEIKYELHDKIKYELYTDDITKIVNLYV